MPLYSFKNKKTRKVWDEILSFKEREELLKDKNIEQVLTAPMLGFIERAEHKGRDQMISAARQGMKERQIEDQVGIRKSPDWLKERTERHLQKVRNVSS
nr:hypothetical protein [uncultured Mediterranean phage uvMED]|tara:strand:+ start:2383 stop:2679 length:297 start_codon:yes stop_codon:yes gene_type:complete